MREPTHFGKIVVNLQDRPRRLECPELSDEWHFCRIDHGVPRFVRISE